MAWAQQGHDAAFRELVRRYERPVFSLLYRMVHDRTLAEDLYVVMAAPPEIKDQSASLEIHVNPLVNWVWIGFGIIAIGTGSSGPWPWPRCRRG